MRSVPSVGRGKEQCTVPRPVAGTREERIGQPDLEWPDRYAEYMVREEAGEELPER